MSGFGAVLGKHGEDRSAFVHFAPVPFCRVNPDYDIGTTPAGLYAYPVAEVAGPGGKGLYASGAPYLFILHARRDARLLEVGSYDKDVFSSDFEKLRERYGDLVQHALRDVMLRGGPKMAAFRTLFRMTSWLAYSGRATDPSVSVPQAWRNIFQSTLGYDGMVDRGLFHISWDIQAQAAFFQDEAFTVEEMIENPFHLAPTRFTA